MVLVEDAARTRDVDAPRRASTTAARPASRGRCATIEYSAPPRACARAAQLLARLLLDFRRHAPWAIACPARRSRRPAFLAPRRAPSGSAGAARATRPRAGARRALPGSARSISRESFSTSMRCVSRLDDALEARAQVEGLEQRLLLGGLHVEEARDQVGERDGDSMACDRFASSGGACGSSRGPRGPSASGSRARASISGCAGAGSSGSRHARRQEREAANGSRGRGSAVALAKRWCCRPARDVAQDRSRPCRRGAGRRRPGSSVAGSFCSRRPILRR